VRSRPSDIHSQILRVPERRIANESLDHNSFLQKLQGSQACEEHRSANTAEKTPAAATPSALLCDPCRKSSIFFATSPLNSSFGLRHLPCIAALCITTNRLEIEGPVQQERGETFQGKKVLAVSSFVSFGGSALVHQPSSSEPDDLETQNRSGAVHRHARHYANQTLRVVRAGANLPHCHLLS
jgi:hypothetical protein